MMLSGLIFIGALFVRTEALKGQNFPIPSEELYEDYTTKVEKKCWTPKNSTGEKWEDCMNKNPLTVDYTCRFSLFGYKCFCCGAFFHYTEHGKICTRFCLFKDGRKFCEPGLIILPFNWGDPIPDKVTLDDAERIRGPDGKVRLKKETEVNVNVTEFKTSDKCPSSPLKFDPEFGPKPNAPLAPGVWENSEWGSNATAKGPGGGQSGEPRPRPPQKPKDWNEIVWSSEKAGSNPQTTTTTTTTKKPLKNRHGDSHTFGGGGNIREQVTKDVTESPTTTRKPTTTTRKSVTDRFGQPVQGWGSEQLRQKPTTTTRKPTEPPTTTRKTTTTRKPMDVKDRFGQLVQATGANWGSQQTNEDPSNIEKRVSTSDNRKEANVRRTTRKSRPTKKKRTTTKRPNQIGIVGINDFSLVDSSGVKLTTTAPSSTTSTTTRSTSTDDRPNWGAPSSSSSPTKRPKDEESTNAISKEGSTATKKQDDKPIWG